MNDVKPKLTIGSGFLPFVIAAGFVEFEQPTKFCAL